MSTCSELYHLCVLNCCFENHFDKKFIVALIFYVHRGYKQEDNVYPLCLWFISVDYLLYILDHYTTAQWSCKDEMKSNCVII